MYGAVARLPVTVATGHASTISVEDASDSLTFEVDAEALKV
jgi:hypothetical protein